METFFATSYLTPYLSVRYQAGESLESEGGEGGGGGLLLMFV